MLYFEDTKEKKEGMMKKVISLMALLVFITGMVFITDNDAFAKRKKDDKAETKTEDATQVPEPKLIYTFKDMEEMGEFEQLYVSKQATFGRMGVLQAYFAMEQNNLAAIDAQMEEKFGFKMDPSRMYDLNRDNLEIRELGPLVAPTSAQ